MADEEVKKGGVLSQIAAELDKAKKQKVKQEAQALINDLLKSHEVTKGIVAKLEALLGEVGEKVDLSEFLK